MTQDQLQEIIVDKFLPAFNDEKVNISEETVLKTVLSETDGKGASNSSNIFKQVIIWTLAKNGTKKIKFPANWMGLTVGQFSKSFTFLLGICFMAISSFAQLQLKLGTVKTDNKQNAVVIGISYIRSLDSIWNSKEIYSAGKSSIFTVNPQIRIETGTQDAFSSIEAKLTGLFTTFKTTEHKGIIIPDLSKVLQTFPISIGAESNNTFSTINGIVEAGWVPYYQSQTSNVGDVLRHTKFGIFLQGGYKFKADSLGIIPTGGAKDQSGEAVNNALFRTKGSFSIDTKKLLSLQGLNVGLVGNADVWYDFVNKRFYNKIEGVARFYLVDNTFFDVIYSKGSGAPNFNQGDQYGVGLVIQF